MPGRFPPRWWALAVFALYSALNYLDRNLLANVAPQLRAELSLSNEDYGRIVGAFSLAYALCSPLAGMLVDRLGLTWGAFLTLGAWSSASIATAFVDGLGGLLACRISLGLAEAGAIPAYSKASATYLEPKERSLGAGLNQFGISLGAVGATLLAGWLAVAYGWRSLFVVTGVLGFLWIPLWAVVSRRVPAPPPGAVKPPLPSAMLGDRRLWALVVANALVMTVYSLWSNWTTELLVQMYGWSQTDVNRRLAWVPSIFATLGGLFGGWLALKWSATEPVAKARMRVMRLSATMLLSTAAVPYMPSAVLATAFISLSYFSVVALSANLYAVPQDLFGAGRAAFAVSAITFGFGLMQFFYSPLVGRSIDTFGFGPACAVTAVAPLCGWLILRAAERDG